MKHLELVSISVDDVSVEDFSSCVMAVPEVKMEKVKLKDRPSFIKQLSSPGTALPKLYLLTRLWSRLQVWITGIWSWRRGNLRSIIIVLC